MKLKPYYAALTAISCLTLLSTPVFAAPCPFNNALNCTLFKDILNDVDANGLKYYGPTNYDHRFSGEIEIFDSNLVQPYTDAVNAPGQIKLTATLTNGAWKSGEIMTRPDLELPPYKAPKKIHPFSTSDIQHGYAEVKLKLPKCETSDDGLCQSNSNPAEYSRGLWPSVWMLPNHDTDWPQNGEIDIWEAYQTSKPLNESTSALHFNGNDPRCGGNDCKFIGYNLPGGISNGPLYNAYHTWGFEWQPDPQSTKGGVILTEYFDNVKLWGPLRTDTLPADGPNAFSRGFHDPNGGFYLIAAVAVGGGYAGNPNPHMRSATMYIQSIKTYNVGGNVQQGTVNLNFAPGIPSQCMGMTDVLNIGANDHPNFTVGNAPFNYTMQVGGPFAVSLRSTSQPNTVPGGTCKGTLNAQQVNVPGQLTATYTFTATPPGDTGTVKVSPSAQSDPKCNTATDTFTLDQNPGVNFTVSAGISQTTPVGTHQVKLASQTSIPAGAGTCSSTLDTAQVNVQKNVTSQVLATYKYQETTGMSCAVTKSTITAQSDWGSATGLVNTFQVEVALKNFPADSSGKIVVNGTMTMKNNYVQNFWANFGMTSSVNQNVGTFNGNSWSTQLIFGGFVNNKTTPMKIGDDPVVGLKVNGVTCR